MSTERQKNPESMNSLETLSHQEIYAILDRKINYTEDGKRRKESCILDETGHVKYYLFGGTDKYTHQNSAFSINRFVSAGNTPFFLSIEAQFFLFKPVKLSNGETLVVPSNGISIHAAELPNSDSPTYHESTYLGEPQKGYWADQEKDIKEKKIVAHDFQEPTREHIETLAAFGILREGSLPARINTKKTALNLVRSVLRDDFAFPILETV
jgi:hypothetical protein